MAYMLQNPDDALVVLFKHNPQPNLHKSREAGRLICDDVEVCEVRRPGHSDVRVFPALSFSHWARDPHTGDQVEVTYAERFPQQYRQFKMQQAQTKSGTPLSHAPFLSPARQAELRALNVLTVEQLASIEGQELKNLGPHGRDLKNKAEAFIVQSRDEAPTKAMADELEALRSRNKLLEEDAERMRRQALEAKTNPEAEFEDMSNDALREFITTHTGVAPQGMPNRRTLIRMAASCKPDKAA